MGRGSPIGSRSHNLGQYCGIHHLHQHAYLACDFFGLGCLDLPTIQSGPIPNRTFAEGISQTQQGSGMVATVALGLVVEGRPFCIP